MKLEKLMAHISITPDYRLQTTDNHVKSSINYQIFSSDDLCRYFWC